MNEDGATKSLAKFAAELEFNKIPENILNYADLIGSTSALLKFTSDDDTQKFIVATEPHIIHQMKKNQPSKEFLVAPGNDGSCSCSNCPYMN